MKSTTALRIAIDKAPIVPVLTVHDVTHAAPLAEALVSGGLTTAEITLRTPAALEVISAFRKHAPDLIVGAGTIVSAGDVNSALDAGAEFLISPGSSPALIEALSEHDGAILPGVATASEAMSRFDEGYGTLKFFPAEVSGGAKFLKSVAAPLPHIDFIPTGGITPGNMRDYLSLPNVIAVGGSWIVTQEDLSNGDWAAIADKARHAASIARKVHH
ncbi:bifunctional 4-hydroxy-2-oxoglutarate aldolase/2-dehydro-3-deoxy-phosphogluconate aldolase [Henriciella sp.]|uniref:bifunctional 4-hydroxy-2-oxoglutarate aldolase/2-dehydro-3-deoxy-phosphogluconate aldolase n=1 Tax=Henriciella sp. TaxID=1968823 RepID=UPI00261FACA5|nr:bifunctional 4-hydroxy-2-oxoglutarate aldolase/2-dehydro-3-deoxy-phosphogluconate aldolase [Henriciella sp.]